MNTALSEMVAEMPKRYALDFDLLYRDNRDDLFAYVCGMLRDRASAEEVTAATFERAFKHQRRFNPKRGNERTWLFGIARNATLDELRRRRRKGTVPADDESLHAAHSTFDAAQSAVDRVAAKVALRSLDPKSRELISLKYFASLTNAEIGQLLDISESNVGTRIHRALQQIRENLNV